MVTYRESTGEQKRWAAVVTGTTGSLNPEKVSAGQASPLSSPAHVHLWVMGVDPTNPMRGEMVADVPQGRPDIDNNIEPGTWTWPQDD